MVLMKWFVLASLICTDPPCTTCGPGTTDACKGYTPIIGWWAKPSDTGHYIGYYVGGGAPVRGDAHCIDEGTWGWDYSGLLFPSRVMLGWYHGRREQGGTGAYVSDRDKLIKHEKPEK